jgi:hypothetical protein
LIGTPADPERNLVSIHCNDEAMREEHITEVKSQRFSDLLGNIGGQLGLFIGMSVITIFELFDLLLLRLLPRFWGDRRLFGIGGKECNQKS